MHGKNIFLIFVIYLWLLTYLIDMYFFYIFRFISEILLVTSWKLFLFFANLQYNWDMMLNPEHARPLHV